jgi:hypothetical protein
MSYHLRNVPVFSTIDMSPVVFSLLQENSPGFFVENLISKDHGQRAEGCDEVLGMGARGKRQRLLSCSAP